MLHRLHYNKSPQKTSTFCGVTPYSLAVYVLSEEIIASFFTVEESNIYLLLLLAWLTFRGTTVLRHVDRASTRLYGVTFQEKLYNCRAVRILNLRNVTEIFILLRLPSSISGMVMSDLWWTKRNWSKFSLIVSVSPANSHSTDCSIFTD
jgi:hypothetical protein